jgi:hypothetical protein
LRVREERVVMVSVRHFALDSLLVACLLVAVAVGVSIPGSHLVGAFLDRYSPSPPPRLASAVPDEDGWLLDRESKHFIYYTRPGQSIPDWAVELHETTYAEVTRLFPEAKATKIKYYKYRSQTDLQQVFGRPRKGYAYQTSVGGTVHSVYSCHPHEVIHAITFAVGRPPALFEEGLAVAYDWRFALEKGNVHALARGRLVQQKLLPLRSFLTIREFQAYDSPIVYIEAGSFVKYLMDTYGPDKMRSLFTLPRYSDSREIEAAFQGIYEQSISEMESEWWAFLRAWRPPERLSRGGKSSLLLFSGSSLVLVLLGGIALSSLVDMVCGCQGEEEISAEEVAALAGTINYEVVTSILPRLTQVYLKEGEVVELKALVEEK